MYMLVIPLHEIWNDSFQWSSNRRLKYHWIYLVFIEFSVFAYVHEMNVEASIFHVTVEKAWKDEWSMKTTCICKAKYATKKCMEDMEENEKNSFSRAGLETMSHPVLSCAVLLSIQLLFSIAHISSQHPLQTDGSQWQHHHHSRTFLLTSMRLEYGLTTKFHAIASGSL